MSNQCFPQEHYIHYVTLEDIQKSEVVSLFPNEIKLIATHDLQLFPLSNTWDPNDDLKNLCYYVQETFLPLSSNAQWVEALVNDADFCAQTGKSESKVGNMSLLRSVMIEECGDEVKKIEEFINSSRRKSDAKRAFVQGDKHAAKTLDFIETMTKEG